MTLLPERLLDLEVDEGAAVVVPRYLTTRDHGWVERLLLELEACEGLARAEVEPRLRELRAACGSRRRACAAMSRWLLRRCGFEIDAACAPTRIRAALFVRAGRAGLDTPREAIIALAARELGVPPVAVARDLYADLPAARRLAGLPEKLSPVAAIEGYNLVLAQSLLLRAQRLEVRVGGNLKAVLRFARLQRLLCLAEVEQGELLLEARERGAQGFGSGGRLQLSGPLALFHRTTKYGRAMARWLPALLRAPRWSLRASCVLGGRAVTWAATHLDPISSSHAPVQPFDSMLERRLFRDLRRFAPAWEVEREADLVQIGRKIACADFTLIEPRRGARVPVEVVGFWTERYLREKLAVLAALPASRPWVVCIDEALAARADQLGAGPIPGPVFVFRRRIDAQALITFVEQQLESTRIRTPT